MPGGLFPVFVGTTAGLSEFYLLESRGFIPGTVTRTTQPLSQLALSLSPTRSLSLLFLLAASPCVSVPGLSLSLQERNFCGDLRCQQLDYSFAHFQEAPFA